PVSSAGPTNTLTSHSQNLNSVDLPSLELPQASLDAMPEAEEFPAGQLIAVVGYEHILAGDMAVFVEPIIEQNRAKIPVGAEERKVRSQLTRRALPQYVELKALYQEFFRDMVGTVPPKELAEAKKKVETKAGKIFFEKQVPVLMEKYKVNTVAELEQKLTDKSLSLTTLRGQFIEQVLASELERKFIPAKFEVDRQDLIDAYRDDKNTEKWNISARARWQQLSVRFDKHATRQEAEARIKELGNEVFYGKSFDAVAKQSSEDYSASAGGVYDWTTQGSLKSKALDHTIFILAPNELSQIIEDDIGLHIVRVLEREDGHVQDFTEAQVELRESLSEERREKEVREFRDRIVDRTTIWTLWPQDIPGSRPLSEALGKTE
ncbi:MAG: peptidylprolyl isomerase, partial [Aureliella sp.]